MPIVMVMGMVMMTIPWKPAINPLATLLGGDCDDDDAIYNPGATEDDCTDPIDYNCDGSVGSVDLDGDGFWACEECDDTDASINLTRSSCAILWITIATAALMEPTL